LFEGESGEKGVEVFVYFLFGDVAAAADRENW
jgi:hypothetical protein